MTDATFYDSGDGINPDASDPQQLAAIQFRGPAARLLAGPGTGKTWVLTERIVDLIRSDRVEPSEIVALTFTRAAAQELRQRLRTELGESDAPIVSTLHSFALRQLMRNRDSLSGVETPLRIADDWEEKNIVLPDLKGRLGSGLKDVRLLLARMSSGWESLDTEQGDWEQGFPDPQFIGEWQRHKGIYGYTLRSELVYQLKRNLELLGRRFDLDTPIAHLLVDEYQDLNKCDVSIIETLRLRGSALFIAGDDDQSIYGFRNAHPVAIRRFTADIPAATELPLETCRRCAPKIIQIATWLIQQEPGRLRKSLRSAAGRGQGTVELWPCADQTHEARRIAELCSDRIADGTPPEEILILLRDDAHEKFSTVIKEQLLEASVPVNIGVSAVGPFDTTGGRQLLSLVRLCVASKDALAWRALIQLDRNGLGETAISHLESLISSQPSARLGDAIDLVRHGADLGRFGDRCQEWILGVDAETRVLSSALVQPQFDAEQLASAVDTLELPARIVSESEFLTARTELSALAKVASTGRLVEMLRTVGSAREDQEPVMVAGRVNVLTMHKAKGLSATTVVVAGAEKEKLRDDADLDEERRLLYVSLSRAREELVVTYCAERTGPQKYSGANSGNPTRTLVPFLADAPIPVVH